MTHDDVRRPMSKAHLSDSSDLQMFIFSRKYILMLTEKKKFSIQAFEEHRNLFKCFIRELNDVIEKNKEKRLEVHKR